MTSSNANASASSEAQNFDSRNSIIIGHTAISKSALEADLRLLMLAFQRKQSYKFSAFADTWKEYNFSLIHFACPEKNGRENFMQALFQIVLGYFSSSLLEMQLGVFYALYLLYFTQPENWERVGIRVTLSTWKSLHNVYVYCAQWNIPDTVYVFHRLKTEGAFQFCASVLDRTANGTAEAEDGENESIERQLSEIEKEVMTGGLGGLNNTTILNELTDFAKRYTETKQRLVTTPQATIFARSMLAGESEEEPDPSVLTNWMVTSALNADSTESIMQIRAAVDRFKEERLQRARAGYYAGAVGLAEGPARAGELNGNRPLNERRAQIRQSDYTNRGYIPAAARATMRSLEREAHAREFSLDAAPPGFGH
ncbi:small nuclear RNA activating complex, subunit SNAP43-domain-containing protein [Jimgerdemannia flammicorona]|uniref:Small nuclear RNA activating complex, subunit SNAP43-domain-containing protein n=1 Tax=Jimgerdemannia flammicorona TaxID=994334 RepID=A0A433A1N4_9FUNG|nr:small nuclear RNA activating complex, subunit SNAP43-domain-containing protein [Jimgerdemannia flammicorona]